MRAGWGCTGGACGWLARSGSDGFEELAVFAEAEGFVDFDGGGVFAADVEADVGEIGEGGEGGAGDDAGEAAGTAVAAGAFTGLALVAGLTLRLPRFRSYRW